MDKKIKIGLGSYTYTWAIGVPDYPVAHPMSATELINRAAMLKAEVVQFADNLPLAGLPDKELENLLHLAGSKNIEIETGSKGLTASNLEAYIRIAERMNSSILRFVIDEAGYQPSIDEVVRIIRPYISTLERKNIHLALENHDRLKCSEFAYIINECNSPNVGICLDTVNSLGALEGTDEVIQQLLPYTVNLHIKDFNIERLDHKMGFKVEGTPAGQGRLDIPGLMRQLRELEKCESAILELWTPFGPSIEATILREDKWAHESMNYLNRITY